MRKNNRGKKRAEEAKKLWEPRKKEIEWLYHDQLWSIAQIGDYFGVSQTGMGKTMKRLNIVSRGRGRKGEENGRYVNGKSARPYRQMIEKDECGSCGKKEELLIHHKNGDHYDNRLKNLQILCNSCHTKQHKKLWWKKKKEMK